MTTPFPLLRLPRLALISVFTQMEVIEIIAFSVLSKRTCNLSKILCKKISSRYIDMVIVNNCLRMRIALTNGSFFALYFNPDNSKTVEVFYPYKKIQWENVGLSTKQCIERVFDVTKCSSLREVILNGTPNYNLFSVFNVVPQISNLHISHNCTKAFASKALQILLPVTSSITFSKFFFSNRREFQRVWMGNIDCLCIHYDDLSSVNFNIDDLLASNAVKLELSDVPMSLRDLNRFFSCWLNKTSNRSLKHLSVKSLEDINEDVLLNGLDATRSTAKRTREFRSTSTFTQLTTFTGVFKVRRIDGKMAVTLS
ncbi:hypothetical protein GCK72_021277 [Caenorhabditis remanei]|uniref:F-box domain-containing protein n=1 Tax=Caenorhabditis remanei TaxID=31234 RepID=A0A6A5GJ49_CAERE|nr:hypothetical protein GCK72_021277 [Caenorhabditis remanei]KAF1754713.1 hypothetical protein GCK72_021277 [Caenorhabditis remanei]